MEPVDLSLRESTDAFSTTNSNADLEISKNPSDGTELLGRDIAIALDTDKRSAGTAADGRVFYADVATDTDYVIAPLPDGGEFSWLLRSPNAPERFVLDLKIPPGAKVRRAQSKNPIPGDPPDNLEIVDGDKVLGYIQAPRTYDADNTPVKSQLVILADDRVAMTVEHQGRDLRYPLLADPEVVVPNDYSRGWLGWRNWYSHGTNWNANTNKYGFALFDPAYNPNGVYLSMPTNTYFWPQGTGVNFSYTAPADTYVYRTIMGSIGHSPMPFWYSYGYLFSHIYSGILNSANNNWEAGQSWLSNYGSGAQGIFGPYGYAIGNLQLDHCFETRCNRAVGSEQNQADFGLAAINNYNANNIFTGNEKATATMGYASVFLGDRYNPWMRADAQPPSRGWTDDSANRTHTLPGVTAEDKGLGVYGITLGGAASGNGTLRPSCDGDPNRNYCPKAWTAYGFSYQLNEGVTTLSLQPQDIVDNAGAPMTWTEKIDRTAPQINALSGSLMDAPQENGRRTLTANGYELQISASDPSPNGRGSSGVSKIEVLSDGDVVYSCGATCSTNWTLDTSDPQYIGETDLEVRVTDGVGKVARQTIPILVDPDATKSSLTEDATAGDAGSGQEDFCDADPDPGPDGSYCSSDDLSNPNATLANAEPSVGTARVLLLPDLLGLRAAGPAGSLAPTGSGWGVADDAGSTDNPDEINRLFGDPRFQQLGIKSVRRTIPWDVVIRADGSRPYTCTGYGKKKKNKSGTIPQNTDLLKNFDAWIDRASSDRYEIALSINKTRGVTGAGCYLPTEREYTDGIRKIMDRYQGKVFLYTAWNEPNHPSQPTSLSYYPDKSGITRAGRYWRHASALCRNPARMCKVAAGEFVDDNQTWSSSARIPPKEFFDAYIKGTGTAPTIWAWHAYNAGTTKSPGRLSAFITRTRKATGQNPRIWLTEQGGRVHYYRNKGFSAAESESRANAELAYELGLRGLSDRISRIYTYHWKAGVDVRAFDSALLRSDNTVRQMYCTLYTTFQGVASCPETVTPPS